MKILFAVTLIFALLATSKANYSPPIALEMAYMSAVAYENILAIDAWNCKLCNKYKINQPRAFINLTSGVTGFTGYSTSLSAIVVAFRGANDINTFIQDLKTAKDDYPKCQNCQVSRSFYQLYLTVQSSVLTNIENLHRLYRSSQIYVTGHGLGATFAQFAAVSINQLYQGADAVYLFGSCRVGNANFASFYAKNIPSSYRIIHYADVVPHLPVASAGYVHAGSEYWYQSDMQKFKVCAPESPDCANSLPNSALNVADNNILNYLNLAPAASNIQKEA